MRLQGARRRVRRSRVALVSAGLVGATFVAFVHDVVVKFDSLGDLLSFDNEWLGVTAAATFLFGAVTIYIARRQFASNLYPYISWTRGSKINSELGVALPPDGKLWCVEVSNLGGGLAIVGEVRYDVALHDQPGSALSGVGFAEMLRVVESTGMRDEHDFVLNDWHAGFGIREGTVLRLWELPLPVARRIRTLDAHLPYSSRVGDVHEVTISCIPPRGLPPEVAESVPPARKRAPRSARAKADVT